MTDKEVLLPISVPKDINQYDSYAAYCYGWNDCEKAYGVKDLIQTLRAIRTNLEVMQGDWLGILPLYAPESTHSLKEMVSLIADALAKYEIGRDQK